VRLSARRLALFVLAAAVLAFGTMYALGYALSVQGSDFVLGVSGVMVYVNVSVLWVILLIDAGVLAIRRRMATKPELVLLIVLGGLVVLLGFAGTLEPILYNAGPYLRLGVLFFAAYSWAPIGLAALGGLVVIIVATIRAPRMDAVEATTSEPSESADLTP
jgi:hypothetical protein